MSKRLPMVLMLALLASCIEVEIAVPSFPAMAQYFHVSASRIQWTLSFNLLGFTLAALCYGPLADKYGRRPLMLIGNSIMLFGALLCATTNSLVILYIGRFIQGAGAACSAVLVFAIIADIYAEQQAVAVLAVFNTVFSLAMALAPLVGVVLHDIWAWRGPYWTVAIISLFACMSLVACLPETLAKHQRHSQQPVVKDYARLVQHQRFLCLTIVPSLLYAWYISFTAIAPFYYMQHLGLSISHYAWQQALIIVAFAVSSLFASRMQIYLGERRLQRLALCLVIVSQVGLVICGVLKLEVSSLVTLAMMVYSMGFAWLYPLLFARSMQIFPAIKGTVASFIMSLRTLLMALLTAAISLIYNGNLLSVALMGLLLALLMTALCRRARKLS